MGRRAVYDWATGRALWDAGVPGRDICRALGCPPTRLYAYAHAHWPPRSRPPRAIEDAPRARRALLSRTTVARWWRARRRAERVARAQPGAVRWRCACGALAQGATCAHGHTRTAAA